MADLRRVYRLDFKGIEEAEAAFERLVRAARELERALRGVARAQQSVARAAKGSVLPASGIPRAEERLREEARWLRELARRETVVRREMVAEAKSRLRALAQQEKAYAAEQMDALRAYERSFVEAQRRMAQAAKARIREERAAERKRRSWQQWMERQIRTEKAQIRERARILAQQFQAEFQNVAERARGLGVARELDVALPLSRLRRAFRLVENDLRRALTGGITDGRRAIEQYERRLMAMMRRLRTINRTVGALAVSKGQVGLADIEKVFARGELPMLRFLRRGTVLTYHMYVKWLLLSGAISGAAYALNRFAFDYRRTMEQAQVGIAGVLTAMAELRDLSGQALSGAEKFGAAMNISADLLADFEQRAFRSNVTVSELAQTFQAILGVGLRAGMSLKEMADLAEAGAIAVRSLGLAGNQVVQELRDLVQGGIQMTSSSLAAALNITDAVVKKWREQGTLAENLLKLMRGFGRAGVESMNLMDTAAHKLLEAWRKLGSEAFPWLYRSVVTMLKRLRSEILVETPDGFFQVRPEILERFRAFDHILSQIVPSLVTFVKTLGSAFMTFAKFALEHRRVVGFLAVFGFMLTSVNMIVYGLARSIQLLGAVTATRLVAAFWRGLRAGRGFGLALRVLRSSSFSLIGVFNMLASSLAGVLAYLTVAKVRQKMHLEVMEQAELVYKRAMGAIKDYGDALRRVIEIQEIQQALETYGEEIERIRERYNALVEPLTNTWGSMTAANEEARREAERLRKVLDDLLERYNTLLLRLADLRAQEPISAKVAGSAVKTEEEPADKERTIEDIKRDLKAWLREEERLVERAKRVRAELQKIAETGAATLANLSRAGVEYTDETLEAYRQTAEGYAKQIDAVIKAVQAGYMSLEQAARHIDRISEAVERLGQIPQSTYDAYVQRLRELAQATSEVTQQYGDAWVAATAKQIKAMQDTESTTNAYVNAQLEYVRRMQETWGDVLSFSSETLGNMSQVMEQFAEQSKGSGMALYNFSKALAIAQILISTATTIMRAWETSLQFAAATGLPPPAAAAMAKTLSAVVAAVGAAQIALVARTAPPRAHAGTDYVPEEQTVLLKRGEMVLDPGTSEKVRKAVRAWAETKEKGVGTVNITVNVPVQGGIDGRTAAMIQVIARNAARAGVLEALSYG